jgi:FdhD protein
MATSLKELDAIKWTLDGGRSLERNTVAEEVPLALVYNGEPFAVMMLSPTDLDDFVIGFSFTEGVVDKVSDVSAIEYVESGNGISAYMSIPKQQSKRMAHRKRSLVGRSGCGICGEETIETVMGRTEVVSNEVRIPSASVQKAIRSLNELQTLNKEAGTLHGAAWSDLDGCIKLLREDVGRHNALDKLIGALMSESGSVATSGFVLMTSRASYELVAKCSRANLAVMVAVSGPTTLAINTANQSGVTLIGFARDGRQTIYANEARIT